MTCPQPAGGPDPARRRFCKMCIGGMTVASAAAVGYPVATFLLAQPSRIGTDKPLEIALDQLIPGQARYEEFQGQQVIVLMTDTGPRLFSASCPHLGCNVIWDPADRQFHCPCHGAKFHPDGKVISGPVSSPLRTVAFEIKQGKLIVS